MKYIIVLTTISTFLLISHTCAQTKPKVKKPKYFAAVTILNRYTGENYRLKGHLWKLTDSTLVLVNTHIHKNISWDENDSEWLYQGSFEDMKLIHQNDIIKIEITNGKIYGNTVATFAGLGSLIGLISAQEESVGDFTVMFVFVGAIFGGIVGAIIAAPIATIIDSKTFFIQKNPKIYVEAYSELEKYKFSPHPPEIHMKNSIKK